MQPGCDCIYCPGEVNCCELFLSLPENRDKTSFNPKLVTGHCQGLDLLFNGVNFRSVDTLNYDFVPNGLDCPNVLSFEDKEAVVPGECPLCDSPGTLKFLKAKRIEYTRVAAVVAHDPLKEEAERAAKDARERAAGKSAERSGGESASRPVGSPAEKGGIGSKVNRALEMVKRGGRRPARQRASSGLAESSSASMGWD